MSEIPSKSPVEVPLEVVDPVIVAAELIIDDLFKPEFTYSQRNVTAFLRQLTVGQELPIGAETEDMSGFVRQILTAQLVVRTSHIKTAQKDASAMHLLLQGRSPRQIVETNTGKSWMTIPASRRDSQKRSIKQAPTRIISSLRDVEGYSDVEIVGMILEHLHGNPSSVPIVRSSGRRKQTRISSVMNEPTSDVITSLWAWLEAGFEPELTPAEIKMLGGCLLGTTVEVPDPFRMQLILQSFERRIDAASLAPERTWNSRQFSDTFSFHPDEAKLLRSVMSYVKGEKLNGYTKLLEARDYSSVKELRNAVAQAAIRIIATTTPDSKSPSVRNEQPSISRPARSTPDEGSYMSFTHRDSKVTKSDTDQQRPTS